MLWYTWCKGLYSDFGQYWLSVWESCGKNSLDACVRTLCKTTFDVFYMRLISVNKEWQIYIDLVNFCTRSHPDPGKSCIRPWYPTLFYDAASRVWHDSVSDVVLWLQAIFTLCLNFKYLLWVSWLAMNEGENCSIRNGFIFVVPSRRPSNSMTLRHLLYVRSKWHTN